MVMSAEAVTCDDGPGAPVLLSTAVTGKEYPGGILASYLRFVMVALGLIIWLISGVRG